MKVFEHQSKYHETVAPVLVCTCLQARWGWAYGALWMRCWQNWCDLSLVRWLLSSGEIQGEMSLGGQASPQGPQQTQHLRILLPRTASSSCSSWCERQTGMRTTGERQQSWRSWWYAPRSPSPRSRSPHRLRKGERCRRTWTGQLEAPYEAWRMSSSPRQRLDDKRPILGKVSWEKSFW